VAFRDETAGEVDADEPGAPEDENPHGRTSASSVTLVVGS
jgi:hypothetical protein